MSCYMVVCGNYRDPAHAAKKLTHMAVVQIAFEIKFMLSVRMRKLKNIHNVKCMQIASNLISWRNRTNYILVPTYIVKLMFRSFKGVCQYRLQISVLIELYIFRIVIFIGNRDVGREDIPCTITLSYLGTLEISEDFA